MLVIDHHDIQDPEKFWSSAQQLTASLSAVLKLHSVYPSTNMKTGTCVWEGPSAAEVQKFIDDGVGSISKNTCYEVNEATAMGTPKMEAAATA